MESYLVPFETAESEFVEKRSRFIGKVWRVEAEEEGRARIVETKKKHYDGRHNCWCYLLRDRKVLRYSDDGEPQGTAGQPMLNVFQREGVYNACCVVTRYFGGVLLGAGGLTRAYAKGAKDALNAAGVCRMSLWTQWEIPCSYPLFEQVKIEMEGASGHLMDAEYGAEILIHGAFPDGMAGRFQDRLTELSAGQLTMRPLGQVFQPGPREEAK